MAMSALLMRRDEMSVVGCAMSWDEARGCLASARPRVILVDGSSMSILRFVPSLLQIRSAMVVAFGVPRDTSTIAACSRAGVHAFCDAQCDEDQLVETIIGITHGELALPPATVALLFRRLGASMPDATVSERAALTQREADVLSYLQTGASNKEIATHLGVSVATVKNHVHSILQKLGVRRRAAVVGALQAPR